MADTRTETVYIAAQFLLEHDGRAAWFDYFAGPADQVTVEAARKRMHTRDYAGKKPTHPTRLIRRTIIEETL